MRRLAMLMLFVVIFQIWDIPIVKAQFSEAGVEKFRVPVEAPDLTLREVDGGKVSLKELRGRIILLNFFASW